MKILHVITSLGRGGAENQLLELVREQVARGTDVAVAYLKPPSYWADAFSAAGVSLFGLKMRRYGDPLPLLGLRRILGEWRPDIVHAHLPPGELYARVSLGGRSMPPLVITRHNDEPFHRLPGHRRLARWVARRADRVIAISGAVNRQTHDYIGFPAERVRTIYYGIDPGPYRAAALDDEAARLRLSWGVNEGTFVIGAVARFVPQKALDVLLRAFATFRARGGSDDARLVLVGSGPLEGELRVLAAELGIGESVVWAGFREDVPTVMRAMDVLALTSLYEGLGLVLLEAMSAGRPVVASAVSAIPEIVVDGVTGLLCPVGDAGAFAAAFARMEEEDFRRRLGGAGRERAAEFTIERMVDRTFDVYRECGLSLRA